MVFGAIAVGAAIECPPLLTEPLASASMASLTGPIAEMDIIAGEFARAAEAVGDTITRAGALVGSARLFSKAAGSVVEGVESFSRQAASVSKRSLQRFGLFRDVEGEGVGVGKSLGAARRLDYDAAPYHGKVGNATKSRAPTNGQDALDVSVQVKSTSPRRVSIDHETGDFVVFDKTRENVYHGHVRSWGELHPDMQRALQDAGMVNNRGKILR